MPNQSDSLITEAQENDKTLQRWVWSQTNLPIPPIFNEINPIPQSLSRWVSIRITNPELLPDELTVLIRDHVPRPIKWVRGLLPEFITTRLPDYLKNMMKVEQIQWVEALAAGSNLYNPIPIGELLILAPLLFHIFITLVRFGAGMGGSQAMNGRSTLHIWAEEMFADFFGYGSAIFFPSGAEANKSITNLIIDKLHTLLKKKGNGRKVRIAVGINAHNSIIDPLIRSIVARNSTRTGVNTANFEKFEEVMDRQIANGKKPDLLILMGVGSTNGELASLPEILKYCFENGIEVLLDDAHGAGVLGKTGGGTLEHLNVPKEHWPRFLMITLSKAFNAQGGVLFGSEDDINWLRLTNEHLFTAAILSLILTVVTFHLKYLKKNPEIFERIIDNNRFVKKSLKLNGVDMGNTSLDTSILPLYIHRKEGERLEDFQERVYEAWLVLLCAYHIHTNLFIYPGVDSKEYALLRGSTTSLMRRNVELVHMAKYIPMWAEKYQNAI